MTKNTCLDYHIVIKHDNTIMNNIFLAIMRLLYICINVLLINFICIIIGFIEDLLKINFEKKTISTYRTFTTNSYVRN